MKVASRPSAPRPGLPGIGVLPRLIFGDAFDVASDLQREHGDVVKLCGWPTTVYLLGHPALAQHVLRDRSENYTKHSGMWSVYRKLTGDDALASMKDGERWLRRRRMLQQFFKPREMATLLPLVRDVVASSLGAFDEAAASRTPLDLAGALADLSMRMNLQTIFSTTIGDDDMAAVRAAIDDAFRILGIQSFMYFLPTWMPMPLERSLRRTLETLDRVIFRIIGERRHDGEPRRDLLDLLLSRTDDLTGRPLADTQLRDEAVTFFIAGYETTATALVWSLYLISQHPEVERRLRTELDAVADDALVDAVTDDRLGYARMVFQEAMRLYPPGWMMPREAAAEDELAGHRIEKHAVVILNFYAIQRHPDAWPDPDAFDPARFADGAVPGRCAYLPFGAGPRMCIGSGLSMWRGPLMLAMLLKRYRIRVARDTAVRPAAKGVALIPRGELRATIERIEPPQTRCPHAAAPRSTAAR